jgi:PAS domain S-box-containing protein
MLLILVAIVGVLRQLRRIEQGEQALLESQERYAMAMEAANEGHTEWNVPQGTVFVSARWCALHGLAPRQAMRTIADVKRTVRIHADDSQGLWTAIDEHLQGLSPGIDVEYRVQHQDGSWKWIQSRGRCVRDAASAPVRLFCAAHDISARKEAEASKIALETHLQQTRRMEALGTLAGGIAHDFNNLLGAILGFGGMARQYAEEGSPMGRHIDRVLQAGSRAKALVNRVLQFSRSGPTERTRVNIQGIVEEATVILAPFLRDGISLQTVLEADGAWVAGDATKLYQVVANLCMNAFQAAGGTGEVWLRLATVRIDEPRTFLHGELAAGSYVRLEVEDSGHGMSPETMGRMFEPFFTTKPPGEGTGLGLSVVHGVVTELGGAIGVRSEFGAGTCVCVWLPVAPTSDAAAAEGPVPDRGGGQVVMIVDDEPLLVELAAEMIIELGYVPLAFESGERACAAFDDAGLKVDLLLTDEMMPGLSGSELVAAIRAKGRDIPVIMMSGNVTAALERRARATGACALLHKPLARETLAAALARCLRRQRT